MNDKRTGLNYPNVSWTLKDLIQMIQMFRNPNETVIVYYMKDKRTSSIVHWMNDEQIHNDSNETFIWRLF